MGALALVVRGTSGSRSQIRAIGVSRGGAIGIGGAGQMDVEFCDVDRMDFEPNVSGATFVWRALSSVFTNCGRIGDTNNYAHPAAIFDFLDSSFTAPRLPNAAGSAFGLLRSVAAPLTTGRWRFTGARIEGNLQALGAGGPQLLGLELSDVVIRSSGNGSIAPLYITGGCSVWTNVLILGDTTASPANGLPSGVPGSGVFTNTVAIRRGAIANPHWVASEVQADLLVDGFVAWTDDPVAGNGDAFQTNGSPSAVATVTMRNSMGLPAGTGLNASASGSLFSAVSMGNTNMRVVAENNTAFAKDTSVWLSENFSPVAGALRTRNNVLWSAAAGAGASISHGHFGTGTPAAGYIINNDFNCEFTLSTPRFAGTLDAGSFASPATPVATVTVDPQFVANTRNPLTFGQSLDGSITAITTVVDRMMNRTAGYTVSAMLAWIRAGFVPTNIALNAAQDGGWMGAVAGAVTPTVANIAPTSGPVGTQVTFTGTLLTGTSVANVNGTAMTGIINDSATQIRATVGAASTTGVTGLTASAGSVTGGPVFTVTATLVQNGFRIVPGSLPVSPVVGVPYTFQVEAIDTTQGNARVTTFNAASIVMGISVALPDGLVIFSGDGDEPMVNGLTSFTLTFTNAGPVGAPTIASFTPDNGAPGTVVTLTGTNFTVGSTFRLNASPLSVTILSLTSATVTIPGGASTGRFTAANGAGSGMSATNFTVPAPSYPPVTLGAGLGGRSRGRVFINDPPRPRRRNP